MPRYVLDGAAAPDEAGGVVPGIYAALLPWAREEYARSGDPRWRYCHPDGEGGVCRGGHGCEHVGPPPNPRSVRKRLLDAAEAGESVVVPMHIARGERWGGTRWSAPLFKLPWAPKEVHHVWVTADDRVTPAV